MVREVLLVVTNLSQPSSAPPSVPASAEDPSTSTTSEAASLRITIPSPNSTRRKQWMAQPTTIQAPANPSRLSAPLPAKRPRGRPKGSTTKRKDASSAPIATRKVRHITFPLDASDPIVKVDLRVNAVASSSAVTLDALIVAQPAWRVVSPAPCATVASDHVSARVPHDPPVTSTLLDAPGRAKLRKRKAEPLPADDAPRKKRRGEPEATSASVEDGPRWLPPRLGATRTMSLAQDGLTCAQEIRPRIWASVRGTVCLCTHSLTSYIEQGRPLRRTPRALRHEGDEHVDFDHG